jgi:uncharacterized delta-60 repeat protein
MPKEGHSMTPRRFRQSVRLRVEALETRAVPAGVLDATFGGGFTVLPVGVGGASALAVQPDEKVVLAGAVYGGGESQLGVVRLDATGHPDQSFPVLVRVNPPGQGSVDEIKMALQPDGKIVIAFNTGVLAGDEFIVARLNADGSPDTTFGIDGQTNFSFGPNTSDHIGGIALQPDGKIVVGGYAQPRIEGFPAIDGFFAAARLTRDGRLDPDFGNGGVRVVFNSGTLRPTSDAGEVAVQADGGILLAGTVSTGTPDYKSDVALVRLWPNGMEDNTFGVDSRVVVDFGSPKDWLHGLALQPDGKVILAGNANWGGVPDEEFAAARLTAAGVLDPTFGTGGKVILGVGPGQDDLTGAAVLANGKIVLSGSIMNDVGKSEIGAVLLGPNGTPVSSFDYDGRAVVPNRYYTFGYPVPYPGQAFASAGVAVTPSGKFVIAGASSSPAPVGSWGFAAARFLVPDAPPSDVTLWHRPVPENSPPGTLVGYLQAFDPDVGDPFTFSLVNGAADNAHFRIKWNMVLTGESFDYEVQARYTIRVRVTDATGLSLEKDLTVNIGNEPEGPG